MCRLLPVCLSWISLSAQQGNCTLTLSGRLQDHASHALQGAELYLEPGNNKVLSDETGAFRMVRICPGTYTLHVLHHQDESLRLLLNLRGDTVLQLFMEHVEEPMHEVVVHRVRVEGIISGEKMRALAVDPGTSGLGRLAGIQLLHNGPGISKPVVQGFWGLRVPVYTGGIRLEGQSWGMEHAPEAELLAYGTLSILRGAKSLTLGHDALGAAIRLDHEWNLNPGDSKAVFQNSLSNNGRSLGQFVDVERRDLRESSWQWKAHAGFRRSGNMFTPDYYLWNTGSERENLLFAARKTGKVNTDWSFSGLRTRQGIFSGAHIGNLTDLYAAMARNKPITPDRFSYQIDKPWQQNEHFTAGWKREAYSSPGIFRKLAVSAQYDRRREFDYNRRRDDPRPQLDLHLLNVQINGERDVKWGERIFRLGGSQRLQVQEYSRVFLVPAYRGWSSGAWLSRNVYWHGWSLDAVIRADAHSIWASWVRNNVSYADSRHFANVSGGISATRKIYKRLYYEQHLLRQWRNPWLNELYSDGVHRGSGAYERGNRNLKSEHSLKWEHHLRYQRHDLFAEWSLFGSMVRNFMNLEPTGNGILTVRGALPLFEYRQYHALFAGTNLQFRKTIDKSWELNGRMDAVYACNLDSGRAVPLLPPMQASLSLSRKMGSWAFNLNPAYTAKTLGYHQGSDFLPPPADYLLIHADISFHKKIGTHNLTLQLGVHNLGNKRYRDYMNRFRYFADEPGRNIWFRAVFTLHKYEADLPEKTDEIQYLHQHH
ncbi:MAG: hypothetical protein RLZZ370_1687 [Bacteroidota bacterium]